MVGISAFEKRTTQRRRDIVHIHMRVVNQPQLYFILVPHSCGSRWFSGYERYTTRKVDPSRDREFFERPNGENFLIVQPRSDFSGYMVMFDEEWQPFENQGPELLGHDATSGLLHPPEFLLNEVTEPLATKGSVEIYGSQG